VYSTLIYLKYDKYLFLYNVSNKHIVFYEELDYYQVNIFELFLRKSYEMFLFLTLIE